MPLAGAGRDSAMRWTLGGADIAAAYLALVLVVTLVPSGRSVQLRVTDLLIAPLHHARGQGDRAL